MAAITSSTRPTGVAASRSIHQNGRSRSSLPDWLVRCSKHGPADDEIAHRLRTWSRSWQLSMTCFPRPPIAGEGSPKSRLKKRPSSCARRTPPTPRSARCSSVCRTRPGVSDEERMKRAAAIIKRAVDNGLTEVQVGRFPNQLFTDRGRAINQQEAGWEDDAYRPAEGAPRVLEGAPRGARLQGEISRSSTSPAECRATSA